MTVISEEEDAEDVVATLYRDWLVAQGEKGIRSVNPETAFRAGYRLGYDRPTEAVCPECRQRRPLR
jgi:hypothetical protein